MNIEVADRLIKLRKEKGYTQESLADALGISRQAVSKWERAEASPDTDNLICLAKLYGVSLDELLRTDETIEEIKEANEDKEEEKNKNYVHIGFNGIHVKDGEDEVHIDLNGIHIKDEDDEVHIDKGVNTININGKEVSFKDKKYLRALSVTFGVISILITVIYTVLGFYTGLWHPLWVMFLTIPVICSIVDCFKYKKIKKFNYPVLITGIYLAIGFWCDIWHPTWVLFISIPLFYIIADLFKREDKVEVNVDDEE